MHAYTQKKEKKRKEKDDDRIRWACAKQEAQCMLDTFSVKVP